MGSRIKSFVQSPPFFIIMAMCVIYPLVGYFSISSEKKEKEACKYTVTTLDGEWRAWKTYSYKTGITTIYQCDDTKVDVSTERIVSITE